jgi:hypothetical protein
MHAQRETKDGDPPPGLQGSKLLAVTRGHYRL